MTTELTKAAQQALDTLKQLQGGCTDSGDGTVEAITVWCPEVIEALERALTQRPAAQTERDAVVTLSARIKELISEHGTLRSVARSLNLDVGYLSRLERGEKVSPSPETLMKLGLRDAGVRYERLALAAQQATSHVETDWISNVIRDVSELPDRSSPDDEPDMMLVTAAELRSILETHAPQQATPEPVGEPAAWRWFNSNGDQVTNWLDFKPSQKASVDAQVAEAGGRVEYAYTRPAPGVPDGFALVPVEPTPEMMEAMPSLPAIGAPGDVELKAKGWSLKAIQNRHRPGEGRGVMLVCSICAKEGPHERHPDAKHWDWFTGYLKKRFVACPRCQQECPQEVNRAKEESQLKPIQKGPPMSNEALRLADELDHLDYDDPRRVAAFLREQAVARAMDTFGHNVMAGQARLQMVCLENKLQNVTAERDQLRAEVERLSKNDAEILACNYPDGEENGPTISAPDYELIGFARQLGIRARTTHKDEG